MTDLPPDDKFHSHTRTMLLAAAGLGLAGALGYALFLRKSAARVVSRSPVVATDFPWDGLAPGVVAIPIGNPGPLMQGAHYLAKVTTSGIVSLLASPSRVQTKATAAGFASVQVYEAGSVPGYFPDVMPASSGTTYWVEGDYVGPSKQAVFPTTVGLEVWYLDALTSPVVPNLGFAPSQATAALAQANPSHVRTLPV